jgi:hypothetical protein
MRTRSLSSTEAGKCYRTYIEDYFTDSLYVLDLYDNGSTSNKGYDIYSYSYGNLASTIKVIPAATPAYLTFTPSVFTTFTTSASSFGWIYLNSAVSSTASTINVYQHNDTLSTHIATGTLSIAYTGLCAILVYSQNCIIVSQGSTYTLYSISQNANGTIIFDPIDITSLASLSPTKVVWRVNSDCSKFAVDSYIFAFFSGSYSIVSNNFLTFAWLALD